MKTILNKKGVSMIGMLIVVVIIMVLTSIMLKNYQKSISTVTKNLSGKPQTAGQSVQDIRNAMHDMEKAAAKRAELPNM